VSQVAGQRFLTDWEAMADAADVENVLAAIDELSSCLAAQDLDATMALLADDPNVTVIPVRALRLIVARRTSRRSLAASMLDQDGTDGAGAIDGFRQREPRHRSWPSVTSLSMSMAKRDASFPTV
jgi:hypothetical protein